MILIISMIAVALLAYANGANDNFKGVASLYGSRSCSYKTALGWATLATCAGSIAAVFLASALLRNFSGKGLVPESLVQSPSFLLSVAVGAGATVLLATRLGFPISTTHGLTGSLLGAGMVAGAGQVNFAILGKSFITPLLFSPMLALAAGGAVYLIFKGLRAASGIQSEDCICVGEELTPITHSKNTATAASTITASVASITSCERRYQGAVLGVDARSAVDCLHFLSAGAVSFARGLNDTPKIAALLLVSGAAPLHWNLVLVAAAMAAGGLLNSRRVAETMSHKLTDMSPGQGFSSNLTTALLVTTASIHGLPVSTTHVSVGALLGMGTVTGQAKWKTVRPVLASWVITLPCAALFAGSSFLIFRHLFE
jgi:inorganic phosphate transporter, PiT family